MHVCVSVHVCALLVGGRMPVQQLLHRSMAIAVSAPRRGDLIPLTHPCALTHTHASALSVLCIFSRRSSLVLSHTHTHTHTHTHRHSHTHTHTHTHSTLSPHLCVTS